MLNQLVCTTTADGLTLHGALYRPASSGASPGTVDGILLLHGVGSNFYSSPLLSDLAARFVARGVTALCANTRGHDFVSLSRTADGPQRQGAAYETVGLCHHDIAAWYELFGQLGIDRIGLVGHSLGAIKAVYASAHHPHSFTRWVAALSPPRLCYSQFMRGPRKKLFHKTIARAQTHLEEGKPESLMRVKYPFPMLISAAGYLEKYGPAEKYDIIRFAHRLNCPVLFTYGELELNSGSAAFANVPEALRSLPNGPDPLECRTIAHADHLYSGAHDTLAREIQHWLRKL